MHVTAASETIRMYSPKKSRGFTLIELLVVIAIIGMLSSIILVSLGAARKKGRDTRRISDLKQMQLALEMYYDANNNTYPNALSSIAGVYIGSVPTDPSGTPSSPISYDYDNLTAANGSCTSSTSVLCPNYVLGGTLEDTGNTVLTNDVDGSPGGTVNCVDPKYCVQP